MKEEVDPTHLDWLVENRTKNQQCALRLFKLMKNHSVQLKDEKLANIAQSLVAATFSLWRAVFLADHTGKEDGGIKAAADFLQKVIEDNAITYVQDKHARDWSFQYYLNNAENALTRLKSCWDDAVPKPQLRWVTPMQRWENAQDLVTKTMDIFEQDLLKAKK